MATAAELVEAMALGEMVIVLGVGKSMVVLGLHMGGDPGGEERVGACEQYVQGRLSGCVSWRFSCFGGSVYCLGRLF